jgi:hypothetical protein
MDSSEEEEEEGDEIKELREQLTTLKLRMNNMDERVAESEIERMDLDDKVDTLRKAVCSKIKRLVKATRNEDLYRAPDPRVFSFPNFVSNFVIPAAPHFEFNKIKRVCLFNAMSLVFGAHLCANHTPALIFHQVHNKQR